MKRTSPASIVQFIDFASWNQGYLSKSGLEISTGLMTREVDSLNVVL